MNEIYVKLADHLKYPKSAYLMRLLKQLLTPEEGELILEYALSESRPVKGKIDEAFREMWRRGMVKSTPDGYLFHSHAFGLFDYSLGIFWDPAVRQLWRDWYEAEWARDIAEEVVRPPPLLPYNNIVPNAQSLDAFKKISKEPVLDDEDPRKIVEKVDLIAVRDCICRVMQNTCKHPHGVCIQFNEYADMDIKRSIGRKISVDEAVNFLNAAAEAGLCHNYNGYPHIHSICNCCSCACIVLNSVQRYRGTMDGVVSKSRFEAVIDQELCKGCQSCVKHCNFAAIDIVKIPGSKKQKARVNSIKCMGCGACYTACKQEAISLKLVREAIEIPKA